MVRSILLILFIFSPILSVASTPPPDIDRQTRAIADQLRCPVCRGIPIADSPADLARDMISIIRQKLEAGESEEAILNYFVDRYGEWILLEPKPQGANLVLWIVPLLFLVGGGLFLSFAIAKWSRHKPVV